MYRFNISKRKTDDNWNLDIYTHSKWIQTSIFRTSDLAIKHATDLADLELNSRDEVVVDRKVKDTTWAIVNYDLGDSTKKQESGKVKRYCEDCLCVLQHYEQKYCERCRREYTRIKMFKIMHTQLCAKSCKTTKSDAVDSTIKHVVGPFPNKEIDMNRYMHIDMFVEDNGSIWFRIKLLPNTQDPTQVVLRAEKFLQHYEYKVKDGAVMMTYEQFMVFVKHINGIN